ncbi:MAG TPA: S1C family serine protease, partial [Trueperaceae bacterium]
MDDDPDTAASEVPGSDVPASDVLRPNAASPTKAARLESGTSGPKPRSSRLVLLLVLLLVALLTYFTAPAPQAAPPDALHSWLSYQDVPEPTPPTGELAEAYALARPASLRIEVSSDLGRRSVVTGIGSGFFISPDGLVLTAYHVVENPGKLTAVGPGGDRYPLVLVGFDAYRDLAVLQANVPAEVPYLRLASAAPRAGSEVVAIGNSRGDFLQPRSGVVLALGVDAPYANFASNTIELTAALFPGDSGGPVVNEWGEAVGVVSYISFYPEGLADGAAQFIPPLLRALAPSRHYASFAVPVRAG